MLINILDSTYATSLGGERLAYFFMLGGGGVPIALFDGPLFVGGGRPFFIAGGCIAVVLA
jgi:hypothetical protein